MKTWWKSWTINYGHIQTLLGGVVLVAPYVTSTNFPNLPPYIYGLAALGGGVATYILRVKTKTPIGK